MSIPFSDGKGGVYIINEYGERVLADAKVADKPDDVEIADDPIEDDPIED